MNREIISFISGIAGGVCAYLLGGWDSAVATLVWFMCIDYIMGLLVAGLFKKSKKTKSGKLSSNAGWKGLCKKFVTLIFVSIGYRIDILMGTHFVKDAVTISFIVNEALSIFENAGLMGLPVPEKLRKAIEVLKKGDENV